MRLSAIFCLLIALAAPGARAQMPPRLPLSVSLQVFYDRVPVPQNALVPQPVVFFIHPELHTKISPRPGDVVMIDFFADGKKLASGKATWHDATAPGALTGGPANAPRLPAQFIVPNYIWKEVPRGDHVISVHAYGFHGASAVGGPLRVTVVPPLPRPPLTGTHTLQGRQRAPLKPEAVHMSNEPPATAYDAVGTVTASSPGIGPQDFQRALAELQIQAAAMGANYVIFGPVQHSGLNPFGGPNRTFVVPETRILGKALYVR